jgi:hypothetical protein
MKDKITRLAAFINERIVGSPWTFVCAIILVLCADLLIPVQGYDKWNLSTGLFFNTQSSNIELITGIGAVVGVYGVHKSNKDLHAKVDKLGKQKCPKCDEKEAKDQRGDKPRIS